MHQQVEALAGGALHDRRHQREADVGVAPVAARRMFHVPCAGIIQQRLEIAIQRHLPVAGRVGQAGAMRQQQAQRDRRVGPLRVAQFPAQRCRHIGVEVEPAFLDQAHHAERDNQFRNRCDPHRIVGGDRAAGSDIGQAGDARIGDAVAVEGHAHAGDGLAAERRRSGEQQRQDQAMQVFFHACESNATCSPVDAALPSLGWLQLFRPKSSSEPNASLTAIFARSQVSLEPPLAASHPSLNSFSSVSSQARPLAA